MGRTQIGGNRISDKSIATQHLSDDFVIPEKQLVLNNPTHGHENKSVLDIITNSNPALVKLLDLKDIALTISEVALARDAGQTLKNTIEAKANTEDVGKIQAEVDLARGDFSTLAEALRVVVTEAEDIVQNHAGIISHSDLDKLSNEVRDARGVYDSLKERIDNSGGGGSGPGEGGSVNINMLTPWNYFIKLEEGQTVIDLPNTFTVGNSSLQVFEGPTLLYPGKDNDYVETSTSQIELNYEIPEGTDLRFIGLGAGKLYEWMFYTISTEGQKEIGFLDSYRPGQRELMIYEDGLLLQSGSDYEEVNEKAINLTIPFVGRSNIAVFKRRY